MRRSVIVVLIALNVLLAAALLADPIRTQIFPRAFFDCCQPGSTDDLTGYCCIECCWMTHDCSSHEECRTIETEAPSF